MAAAVAEPAGAAKPAGGSGEHHDVVVIGAGVSGLATAWHLRDRDVLVLEETERVGGRIRSERRGDTWLNFGAHVYGGDGTATDRLLRGLGVTALPLPGTARRARVRRPHRHQPGRDLSAPAAAAGALSRGAGPRRPQAALRRRPLRPDDPAAARRVRGGAAGPGRQLHGRRVVQRPDRPAAAGRGRDVPLHADALERRAGRAGRRLRRRLLPPRVGPLVRPLARHRRRAVDHDRAAGEHDAGDPLRRPGDARRGVGRRGARDSTRTAAASTS